jgi:hypothetical protein
MVHPYVECVRENEFPGVTVRGGRLLLSPCSHLYHQKQEGGTAGAPLSMFTGLNE